MHSGDVHEFGGTKYVVIKSYKPECPFSYHDMPCHEQSRKIMNAPELAAGSYQTGPK